MPLRYRPDALSLPVNEIRQLLPGRKIARLVCPQCGRQCQMVFKHPDSPNEWKCKVCQQFTVGRNGQYALGELARARNMLDRIARERLQQRGTQEGHAAAQRQRTRKDAAGDEEVLQG